MTNAKLLKELIGIGCIKFGDFTLESGKKSPIYVDLQPVVNFPSTLVLISDAMWELKKSLNIDLDVICGIPYTALAIATKISSSQNIMMLIRRKQAKTYGTKKLLEGDYKSGQKCLVIEDIATNGSSVIETVEMLVKEGLEVTDCLVLFDREQGANENLANCNIKMHSLFKLSDVLHHIPKPGTVENVQKYKLETVPIIKTPIPRISFRDRVKKSNNAVFKKLCNIIEEKQSNLCVAVDVTSSAELFKLAKQLGPYICILKTHIDILTDFNDSVPAELKRIAGENNFLLLEDGDFADIGNTVLHQYNGGMYKINDWADIVTVHSIPGEDLLKAMFKTASSDRACILSAQVSSKSALTVENYAKKTVHLAEQYKHFVIGFLSQSAILTEGTFLHFSAEVDLLSKGDDRGQHYRSIEEALMQDNADIVVVGRGITESQNIVDTAKAYKEKAFDLYKRTSVSSLEESKDQCNKKSNTKLLEKLIEMGCIKFGDFTLKSGQRSPIYIDLRSAVCNPSILALISEAMWDLKKLLSIDGDVICGVPYTAFPIAVEISTSQNVSMIIRRKEAEANEIDDWIFKPGQKCVIIEDIVTSGLSIIETVEILEKRGFEVTDCLVILNREQGAHQNLLNRNIRMHSLFNLSDVLQYLAESSKVEKEVLEDVRKYITQLKTVPIETNPITRTSFRDRGEKSNNTVFKKLCDIIEVKESNLCVAVDVTSSAELLQLAKQLGPYVCILKTHINMLTDFNDSIPAELKKIAQEHNFLLMEDKKFAAIENVVFHQYNNGMHRIRDWADIVTVHSIHGENTLKALSHSAPSDRACLLIAQMSSKGALTDNDYVKETMSLAEKFQQFVIGFICQSAVSTKETFFHVSPGVNLSCTKDDLGQQYRSIDDALIRDDVDIVIVGRGITQSQNIVKTARLYKEKSFDAYKRKMMV